jgi:hypothetical protein
MRNTTPGEALQGFSSPQTLQEIVKIGKSFTSYYDLQDVEKHLQTVLYAWIGSETIENQQKATRENTFSFLTDFQLVLKSFFDDTSKSKEDVVKSIIDFFDNWSGHTTESLLKEIKASFVYSDLADSKEIRTDGFEFLELIEDLLKKITALKN